VQIATDANILNSLPSRVPAARVRIYENVSDLPESYVSFFAKNAERSFFLSLPWYQNFCRTALAPSEKIRIFALESSDSPASPLAALLTRHQSSLKFRSRMLSSLSNFYTSLYMPLISSPRYSASFLSALSQAIVDDPVSWDLIDLKWLERDALNSSGMIVQSYFCAGNWYLPVQGRSYREYFHGLPSSVRNIATSKNRKLERSGRARFEVITGLTGLEAAIENYQRIYASSWKVPEPFPHFIPGLIRTCASQGWLRLGMAYIDGEPAASQIWIVSNGLASIYKMAYDQRFADLSVGSFLTTRMMEYALDVDEVKEVDYLTGDDRYKKDWMSHRRERWGILAMNPRTVRGSLAIARHVGGRALKRGIQRSMKAVWKLRKAPL
jgi:Acetyltransferase (GNAT) domain